MSCRRDKTLRRKGYAVTRKLKMAAMYLIMLHLKEQYIQLINGAQE